MTIEELKEKIAVFLTENKRVYLKYGQNIDNTQNSEKIFQLWQQRKETIIIPNNKAIVSFIKSYKSLFTEDEYKIANLFILHVKTYEAWINKEISYKAVVAFPVEFERMIMGDKYLEVKK